MYQQKPCLKDRIVSLVFGIVIRIKKNSYLNPDYDTVKRIRKQFNWLGGKATKAHSLAEITKTEIAGVPAEKISFKGISTDRLLFYIHGGGYVFGSPLSHRALASRVGWAVRAEAIVPDYRLAPENPYPAGLDDVVSVYKKITASVSSPKKIIIAGDSAGGGMTLALILRIRDEGLPMPGLVCCLSPWADLTQSGESQKLNRKKDRMLSKEILSDFAAFYAPDTMLKDPYISPVFGDYKDVPPILIQVGTSEVLLDDARRVAAAVKAAGGDVTLQEWRDMQHVWQFNYRLLDRAGQAVKAIGEYAGAGMES